MNKKWFSHGIAPWVHENLRKMKLTIFILCISTLTSLASLGYAQSKKLTVIGQNIKVIEILSDIEDQSEFRFFFSNDVDVDRITSIDMKNKIVFEILDELFKNTNIKYEVYERQIALVDKSDSFFNRNYAQQQGDMQQKTVSGRVTDEQGQPLPGVTVVVKGTTQGTVTNANGEYSLPNIPDNAILVFSFVGMKTQDVVVGDLTSVNVIMEVDAIGIEEVVAIGYGTVKKSDLTGAVMRVERESFQNQASSGVIDMLAGSVAGLNIAQSNTPGGESDLEVRGPTSLTGETNPLVVLDGVIYNGNIADINPNDIKSVDVLKDASSAAVYGSKAASGVVIITTIKGKMGKPSINFTTKIGVSGLTNKSFGPRDGKNYEDYRRDYYRTLGVAGKPDWYWDDPHALSDGVSLDQWRNASNNPNSDNTLEYLNRLNFFDTEKEQYLAGNSINWFDEVMQTGIKQDYDLSVSGGAENYNYYWSIGYTNNEGVIKGDEYSTVRSRLNADYKISDWLKVGVNSQFASNDQSSVPASTNFGSVSPYGKVINDDGTVNWYPHDYEIAPNPLVNYYNQQKEYKTTTFFASLYTIVSLPLGFKYKLSYQPRYVFRRNYNFWGSNTITGGVSHSGGYGTRSDFTQFEWMVDNLLTWEKKIGIHGFDFTFLYNAEQIKSYDSSSSNETFMPNEALGYNALQFGVNPLLENDDTQAGGDALMGRMNYSLLEKYLFSLSVRRDGYSAFGQDNPRATFPAASFAWKISEEEFFNSEVINRMKLRTSWGVNGNRDIGIYSALAQIGNALYYDGSGVQMGLYNSSLANPSLRWERTESFNVGIDVGLFNNRIDISAEAYTMTTTDLLMNRKLPEITGFTDITTNLGELGNRGFELTLNTVNISKADFTWKSNLVFSFNRNKIIELFGDIDENGDPVPDYTNHWFPGEAIDVVWDYNIIGVWQLDEKNEAARYNMVPGDYKGEDLNDDGRYDALIDKQFIGYDRPQYRLGFRNDFTFLKNFTASVFLRGDLGYLGNFDYAIHESSMYNRLSTWNVPYWTPTNENNEYARTTEVHGAYGGGLRIFKPRSFVRVQDLSLSYKLPKLLATKMKLNGMRVFVSGRNLVTFTKWPGWDPESGNDPMPRTITLGLSLSI